MKKENKLVADNRRFRQITRVLVKHKIELGVNPEKVRLMAQDLGPTFVKMGQIMSMRDDIIPLEYCEELKKLRLHVEPMSFDVVTAEVEKATGKKINEIFKSVSDKPLGSASIGQVHEAVLLNGEDVVFKIMRPGIYQMVESDIRLLKLAVNAMKIVPEQMKKFNFEDFLNETWETMKKEMDFTTEVNNNRLFASLNKDIAYIAIPKIYDEYVTPHFFIMEKIDGIQIDNVEALKEGGYDISEIAQKLVNNYITQIVEFGVFHADPHPGNIFIREGKIVWIDFGMMGTVNQKDRSLYRKAIQAFINQDAYEMQNIVLTFGAIDTDNLDYSALYADIENLIFKYSSISMGDINMGELLEELFTVVKHHEISLPKGMTTLGRGVLTLQGLIAEIDPTIDVLAMFIESIKAHLSPKIDFKESSYITASKAYNVISKTAHIPSQISTILDLTAKGRASANINISNIDIFIKALGAYASKTAYSKIIASFAVAVGLIMAALLFTQQNIFVTLFAVIVCVCGIVVIGCLLFSLLMMLIRKQTKDKNK